jgi:hypothetical protein
MGKNLAEILPFSTNLFLLCCLNFDARNEILVSSIIVSNYRVTHPETPALLH